MGRLMRGLLVLAAMLCSMPAVAQNCGTLTTCPNASTPLSGSEFLYLVQGGASKKITVGNLFSAASVSSVSNSNGTLTILPTTGNVIASLNLAHANTWLAAATYPSLVIGAPTGGNEGTGTLNAQGLYVNGVAVEAGYGTITLGETATSGFTNTDIIYNNNGVVGQYGLTGTGSVVMSSEPSIASPTITTAFTATGLVTNADLANDATTVNGETCTLGGTCTVTAAATQITPGTTTISSATAPCVIENTTGTTMGCNALTNSYLASGTFANITGVGTLTAGSIGTGFTAIANSALANDAITIAGTSVALGGSTSALPSPGPIGGTTPNTGAFTTITGDDATLSAVDPFVALNGDTSAGEGPYVGFERGGTEFGAIGSESVLIGGNNSDLALLAESGDTIQFYVNSDTTADVQIPSKATLDVGYSGGGGAVVIGGSTSGTTTLSASATAGTTTATLPDNTGTLAELNLAQTWSALQTFDTSDLAINGGSATAGLATVTSAGVVSSEANATVAQGGTGGTSASGTLLDNITGFSSTGLIDRTGAGAYSFTPPGTNVLTALGNAINAASGLPNVDGSITTGDCLEWGPGIEDSGSTCGSGGGGSPGGSSGAIQYNDSGSFGGVTIASGDIPLGGGSGAPTDSGLSPTSTGWTTQSTSDDTTHIATTAMVQARAVGTASLHAYPSNPTDTSSSTPTMAGLGSTCTITPNYSGRLDLSIGGNGIVGATGDAYEIRLYYGSGTAPSNGASVTGTALTATVGSNVNGNSGSTIFFVAGIATGLTPGTAYWFDLAQTSPNSVTVVLENLTCNAREF